MKVDQIKDVIERRPFRSFALRLNNGVQYTFSEPRDVGATKDYTIIVHFGESRLARIDADSIVEINESN